MLFNETCYLVCGTSDPKGSHSYDTLLSNNEKLTTRFGNNRVIIFGGILI
ncbi:MAG: hypothetical protein ACI9VN_000718 [Patescibacteria group bacterium]|jgi:hypothetical protein